MYKRGNLKAQTALLAICILIPALTVVIPLLVRSTAVAVPPQKVACPAPVQQWIGTDNSDVYLATAQGNYLWDRTYQYWVKFNQSVPANLSSTSNGFFTVNGDKFSFTNGSSLFRDRTAAFKKEC